MYNRKKLWVLFSLILVFFFVGCSDFYQDIGGSSIEMSFKVPEKIDNRTLELRSVTESDVATYKLVVKLESKNEVLDKIEKNVTPGELVNLAFLKIKKSQTVKVSAQLFQDGKSVYFGESDWINTTKGKNYAKVVLEKDYRPLVPTVGAIDDCIKFNVKNQDIEIFAVTFIANIEYEQNLSVQLQEKTEEGWKNYESDTVVIDDENPNFISCMETIQLNIGESKVFRAAFTNSVTTETGKINSVTVYSKEVTLAYVNIDDYSLKHDNEYVIYGEEINKEDFKLFANYTLNDNKKSAPVIIKNVTFVENSIGNVPFTFEFVVPYAGETKLTTTIPVPVKYQLNADKLAITAFVKSDENTQEINSESGLNIAQYTQNVQLSANYDDTVSLYTEGIDNSQTINILDFCNINWASSTSGSSIGSTNPLTIQDESKELLQGLATYECTITPNTNSDFIVGGSVTKEYFVNVCPWEIALTKYQSSNPDGFDNKTLDGGTTYKANLKNEAMDDGATFSDVTYSVTGKDYSIVEDNNDVIQAPTASTTDQNATIYASWKGKEIASLEVVVPASSTSGGTTGGGTGNTEATVSATDLTFNNTNQQMIVKSYEGLKTVAKIINGEIEEGETISISSSQENGADFTYSLGDGGLDTIGILLSDDIILDSDWTGIGTEENPYNGIFNGDGYSIKYNGNTEPLFNNAGGSMCKISSLVVNGDLTSSEPYLGGIVSSFSGGIIENCVNNAIIINSYTTDERNPIVGTGGIVGYLDNAINACTIQKCVNLGNVTGMTKVGGIVGFGHSSSQSAANVDVEKCINIGDIATNSTKSGAFQAGIVGYCNFNVTNDCINIEDCLNKGKIVYNYNTSNAAGIVNNISHVKVTNCINAGSVNLSGAVMISDSTPTNSYWDITVNSEKTSDENAKTTEKLVNGQTTLGLANWVFSDEGNSYPYPDIGSVLPGGEWEKVLEALEVALTSGGSELIGEEVASFAELQSALADQNLTTILIVQDINVTECLNIERSVTIAANSDVTLVNQLEKDYMFWLTGAELTLGGGAGCLTIQGNSENTMSTITGDSSENVINIKDNAKFSGLYQYAVSITNAKTTVNIEGGVFEDNNSIPIYVGAGTLNINGGTIYCYNGSLIKYSKETTIVILGTALDTSSGGYYSENIINGQIVN